MKSAGRFAVTLLIALTTFAWSNTLAAGPGSGGQGGHGGFGGHGGGHASGGHSGHGGFSSGGAGHSVGRSLGRIFGHHSKGPVPGHEIAAPDNGPAVTFGAIQPAGPKFFVTASRRFHHRHANDFPFGDRFLRFPGRPGFGFDGCGGFVFPRHRLFFGDDFNCFGAGFFFDPFFLGGFSDSLVQADTPQELNAESDAEQLESDADLDADTAAGVQLQAISAALGVRDEPKKDQPVTLMQLRDGSMYGLTDYWLEGGLLHYKTTYGGENSIPLDRVDLDNTAQLNSGRGVVFDPKAKNR